MKITFLRHGSLLPPFDNYNELSLQALSQLAKQEIDPAVNISKIYTQLDSKDYLLKKYDALFVSESQRTLDTAVALAKKISLPSEVILPELNEIIFDPAKLVTKKEYNQEKLVIIRKRLFEALANNSNIESGKEVQQRIQKLDNTLRAVKMDTVLVITHGFFMRYLDIFYRQKSADFSKHALNQAINYEYISGFTVIVN